MEVTEDYRMEMKETAAKRLAAKHVRGQISRMEMWKGFNELGLSVQEGKQIERVMHRLTKIQRYGWMDFVISVMKDEEMGIGQVTEFKTALQDTRVLW